MSQNINIADLAFVSDSSSQFMKNIAATMQRLEANAQDGLQKLEKAHEKGKIWQRFYNTTYSSYTTYVETVLAACPKQWRENKNIRKGTSGIALIDGWKEKKKGGKQFSFNMNGDEQRSGDPSVYVRFEKGFPVASIDFTGEVKGYLKSDIELYNKAIEACTTDEEIALIEKPELISRTIELKVGEKIKPEYFGMVHSVLKDEDRKIRAEDRFRDQKNDHLTRQEQIAEMFTASYK